jgi:polysaccharide biosynthesis/export protein
MLPTKARVPTLRGPETPVTLEPKTEASPTVASPPPIRFVRPITTRSDFEQFAEDAAGHPLQVYGRQLFDEVPSTFAPADHIPVPADYAIGPGDELLIRVWGKIDLDSRVTVDRNGQIFLPKVGAINVAGLRYEQLESYIRSAVGSIFKGFELNIALGRLRSIQIYVLGSAQQPGAYTVSSLSTLVNALFASGGPSATGTMRRIELRRGNQLVTEFDIYDLLRKGDKSHDVQLLPGDVIYIPSIGPQVAILGNVHEPGIFELKGEATIDSTLEVAGGLTSLAGAERALLERVENHERRRVDEFALDAAGMQRGLKDGDLLRIFPLSPRFQNAVTLRGNVAQPGRYSWHEGMRVSDLIRSRDSLLTRNYWNQQNFLIPENPNNPFSTRRQSETSRTNETRQQSGPGPRDEMNSAREQSSDRSNQIDSTNRTYSKDRNDPSTDLNSPTDLKMPSGANSGDQTPFRNNDGNPYSQAMSPNAIVTGIALNNAEINWDYAVIERLDSRDLSTRLVPFHLGRAIDNPSSADNQPLEAGDVLTVFSRRDIPLPLEKHATYVRIGGEVDAPGVYRVNPGHTVRDVVQMAGGLTMHSYLYATVLTRVSTRIAEEEQLRLTIDKLQKELISRYANASQSASEKASDQQAQMNMQQALIARLAEVRPTGRVVLNMKRTALTAEDLPDMVVEDGDSIYVPPLLGTVRVSGAVYNEAAFRYEAKKPLMAYLNDAGGTTREGDTKRIYVIRADGAVFDKRSRGQHFKGDFEKLILMPGDAIVVPPKLKAPGSFWQALPGITQVMTSAAMTGAVLASLP